MSGWKSTKDGKHFLATRRPGIYSDHPSYFDHSNSGSQPSSLHHSGSQSASRLHTPHDLQLAISKEFQPSAKPVEVMLNRIADDLAGYTASFNLVRLPTPDLEEEKYRIIERLTYVSELIRDSRQAMYRISKEKNIHIIEADSISVMNDVRYAVDVLEDVRGDMWDLAGNASTWTTRLNAATQRVAAIEEKAVKSHDIARKLREADNILNGIPKNKKR